MISPSFWQQYLNENTTAMNTIIMFCVSSSTLYLIFLGHSIFSLLKERLGWNVGSGREKRGRGRESDERETSCMSMVALLLESFHTSS